MMEVQDHSENKRNRYLNKTGSEVQGNMVIISCNIYTSQPNSLVPYHWKSVYGDLISLAKIKVT
jgi:hypothetical protein